MYYATPIYFLLAHQLSFFRLKKKPLKSSFDPCFESGTLIPITHEHLNMQKKTSLSPSNVLSCSFISTAFEQYISVSRACVRACNRTLSFFGVVKQITLTFCLSIQVYFICTLHKYTECITIVFVIDVKTTCRLVYRKQSYSHLQLFFLFHFALVFVFVECSNENGNFKKIS